MHRSVLGGASLTLLLLVFVSVPAVQAQCVSGTISAELMTDGIFAGYYKYTLEITWDTPQGLSNATLDCGFGMCAEAACARTWLFDEPAGIGTGGEPDACEFDLIGEFNCNGNPSIGVTDPVLKWEVPSDGDCEGGKSGTAVLCFYTDVAPLAGQMPVAIVKNGTNICEGIITGVCPIPCPVPVHRTNWGRIKSLY